MPRGRTRTFNADVALERALDLFSRQGYLGTSIAELTAATGVNPPSLYATFGNKRDLFNLAVARYGEYRRSYLEDVEAQPTARLAAQRFLAGAIEPDSASGRSRGCLTVLGCLVAGPDDQDVAELLAVQRADNEKTIRRRLRRGVGDGDLPPDSDCATLARYLATVAQGISVQASAGASPRQLRAVAAVALDSLPAG